MQKTENRKWKEPWGSMKPGKSRATGGVLAGPFLRQDKSFLRQDKLKIPD
jgi:hypothetical protein